MRPFRKSLPNQITSATSKALAAFAEGMETTRWLVVLPHLLAFKGFVGTRSNCARTRYVSRLRQVAAAMRPVIRGPPPGSPMEAMRLEVYPPYQSPSSAPFRPYG